MRVRVGDDVYRGPAVDLTDVAVDGETVAGAVRGETVAAEGGEPVSVACLQPSPVHERVGHVRPGMSVRVRTALAAAARSRGLTAPQDDQLRAVRERLAGLDPPAPGKPERDLTAARRRQAGTAEDVERLRERVATLRGRLSAAREAGRDTDGLEAELAEAARDLSEAETERAAAREAVERAREQARAARDRRERRRRLEDERANLARAARAHLADELHEEFATALDAVPGRDGPSPDPVASEPHDPDPVSAALAVCRVARLHAPVVLERACGRFPDPAAAADWLDAPVVRV